MWQDLRFGLRMLRKSPGFTVVAVLTLALGIGATTAIFSVFKAVVLQPLPFPEPDRLVTVWERGPKHGDDRESVNRQLYADWKEQNDVFSDMTFIWKFSYMSWRFGLVGDDSTTQQIPGRYVPSSFFKTLGVAPILGRTFEPEEDVKDPDPVVVISHHFWQQRFGGAADVVGRTVMLDNFMTRTAYTVVGVMPPGFEFPAECEIWITAGCFRAPPTPTQPGMNPGKGHDLLVIARLKPGVTVAQAETDVSTISARVAAQFPDAWFGSRAEVVSLNDELGGDLKRALWVLVGAVAAVLLIACANIANLLLARAATREREIALRSALGASRGRVTRQLLTESLLLAVMSGALGVLLAVWGIDALMTIVPSADSSESHASMIKATPIQDVPVDGTVLGVAISVTLLTGIFFGMAPVMYASKSNLVGSLNETGRSSTRSRASQRILHALVSGQVAMALVLLIGAVLMIQSFARLLQVDPGFEPQKLLTGAVDLSKITYRETASRVELAQQLVARAEAIPGVESACGAHELPMEKPGRWTRSIIRDGQQDDPPGTPLARADIDTVTPNFFKTMQIPLLAGRAFNEWDTRESTQIVMINQKLARQLWPNGETAVGKTIGVGHTLKHGFRMYEVVGVVGDTRSLRLDRPGPATVYTPFAQMWPGGTTVLNLIVRTTGEPMTLASPLQTAVLEVTVSEPITNVRTIESVLGGSVARSKFQMSLLGIFAAVALVLAAMGIYGVVSWWVNARVRDIGIRMALGARPRDVMQQIVLHGLKLTMTGVVIGLSCAWSLTRILQSQLYDTPTVNPAMYAGIAVLLLIVATLASIIPARRAMKVDPMTALRCE